MEFMLEALSFANAVDEIGVVNAIVRTMRFRILCEGKTCNKAALQVMKFFQNEVYLSVLSPLVIR